MPTLEEATRPIDMSSMVRVSPQDYTPSSAPAFFRDQQFPSNPNPILRCPLPPVQVTPDSLRQYYQGGLVPQNRILTPTNLSTAAGSGTTVNNTTINNNSTTPTTPSVPPVAVNASLTTPPLNPSDLYQTVIQLAKDFDLLMVSTMSPARVELYATNAAQIADSLRPNSVAPNPSTQHGVLSDFWLDTTDKFSWLCSPIAPGFNGDSPQTSTIYITLTNIGGASQALSVSLLYVPKES